MTRRAPPKDLAMVKRAGVFDPRWQEAGKTWPGRMGSQTRGGISLSGTKTWEFSAFRVRIGVHTLNVSFSKETGSPFLSFGLVAVMRSWCVILDFALTGCVPSPSRAEKSDPEPSRLTYIIPDVLDRNRCSASSCSNWRWRSTSARRDVIQEME